MAANVNGAAGYVYPRSIAITSTGRLWQLIGTTDADPYASLQMWYSDDNGSTWSRNANADIMPALVQNVDSVSSLFIDQDDHAHVAWATSTGGSINYARMANIGATTSWSPMTQTVDQPAGEVVLYPHIVVHREGTGWKAHIVYVNRWASGERIKHNIITVTAGGATSAGTATVISSTGSAGGCYTRGLDFRHTTASVLTVQSGTPNLYASWTNNLGSQRVYCARAAYGAGAWTWGSEVDLGTGSGGALIFDGTRIIVETGPGTILERDETNSTTTKTHTLSGNTIQTPQLTFMPNQDLYVVGHVTGNTATKYRAYTRATDTWGSETALATETVSGQTTVRRGGLFAVDASWRTPSSVRFARLSLPSPPTAATWVNTDGPADVGATLTLDWDFQDPLPGDTQGAYAVKRQIGAGTLYYWRASDSSWQTTEQKNSTATTSLALSSGWGADGDANHKYSVKTWDAADSEGVYGSELTVTPSVPSNPTLVTPVAAGTVGTSSLTAAWTVTDQSAYLVELLDSGGTVVLWSSGWVSSSAARSCVVGYALVNTISYYLRLTTKNSEGLAAAAVSNGFTCAYTPPATPTVTVTANSTLGKITVAHSNPTPVIPVVLVSGGHTLLTSGGDTVVTAPETPTVTSVDVFVRCAAGTYAAGERPVGGAGIRVATGVAPGASWTDWAAPSGRAQEYLVRVWAANGTYTDSAWTA